MSTKRNFRLTILVGAMIGFGPLMSQVTTPANIASATPTDFVGWENDPANQFELNIKHEMNFPIQWFTDDIQRMLLKETDAYTVNGWPVQGDGSLLLCPDITQFNGPGPFTRLHLADDIAGLNDHEAIYRDWMKNGITMTGNGDGMYVGQRYNEGEDRTDATITWSDNPGEWRRDRLTFNFVSGTGLEESGCDSPFGIQTMLVQPDEDCRQAYVGIGDFDAVSETPNERLDVLDGGVKIRELPTTPYLNDQLEKMVVVDDDGLLHWRPITALPDNCEWTMSGGANNNNVWTAVGTGTNCPNQDNRVGIGVSSPSAKLHVYSTANSGSDPKNIFSKMDGSSPVKTSGGFDVDGLSTTATDHIAVRARSYNGTNENVGVYARGKITNTTISNTTNIGVMARGEVDPNCTSTNNYGLYAYAAGGTNNWAGYFGGNVHIQGNLTVSGTYPGSDAALKTNVNDLQNALELIEQLAPKRYDFLVDQYPQLGLPSGEHMGFIAQEIQQVLPGIVQEFAQPEMYDTLGNIVAEGFQYLGVNYTEVIPILVAAVKEQQAVIQAQEAQLVAQDSANQEIVNRLDQLEQLLALCCQNPLDGDQRNMLDQGNNINDPADDRNLRIQPNPFNEQTTVYYNLERSGRMQLMANSSDGKQLRVLQEAQMKAGQYQYEWYTADLSAGIYYVTLLLDGEPIVKKAVKVN